jgi:hypothetical protein
MCVRLVQDPLRRIGTQYSTSKQSNDTLCGVITGAAPDGFVRVPLFVNRGLRSTKANMTGEGVEDQHQTGNHSTQRAPLTAHRSLCTDGVAESFAFDFAL